MNTMKSMLVIILLLTMVSVTVWNIRKWLLVSRYGGDMYGIKVFTVIACIVTVGSFLCFGEYSYPYDRSVDMTLVAVVEIPDEAKHFKQPGVWYGEYGEYGLYPGSDTYHSNTVHRWIDADLEKYSYIVSLGQEVHSLSYNVWDTIDAPFFTGAKAGQIVLSEKFDGSKIYIYQIPKIRIDNMLY